MQEPVRIARLRVRIHGDRYIPPVHFWGEIKSPEELRHGEEQVALGEMDAGTDPPSGAVAVMVSLFEVGRGGVVGREQRAAGVALGLEDVGAWVAVGIVMESPHVQNDRAVFGDAHAFDRVFYRGVVSKGVTEAQLCGLAPERDGAFSYPHSQHVGTPAALRAASAWSL